MKACARCGSTEVDAGWVCRDCRFVPAVIEGVPAFAEEFSEQIAGFDATEFDALAEAEGGSAWFVARNELISWAVRTHFPKSRVVHEVGCGTGFVLAALRRALPLAHLSGSEVLIEGIGHAASRVPSAAFFQIDTRHMPFREEFDLIGAFDVLEHIDDDVAVLSELRAALQSRGGLVLTVPQHGLLWSRQDELAHHVRRYSAREIEYKVRRAGFEILRSTSFVTLLLPALVLVRGLGGLVERQTKTASPKRSTPTERVMSGVLHVERRMIQAGVPMPVGGSRLIVARRLA